MTTTIPAQTAADDIRIIQSPPTITDAQLILQLQMAASLSGGDQGWTLLQAFETPPTDGRQRK